MCRVISLLNHPSNNQLPEDEYFGEFENIPQIDIELIERIQEVISNKNYTGHETVEELLGTSLHNEILSHVSPDIAYNLITQIIALLINDKQVDIINQWVVDRRYPLSTQNCTASELYTLHRGFRIPSEELIA